VAEVKDALFYTLARSMSYVDFSALSLSQKMSFSTAPYAVDKGSASGAERFVQYSCSSNVCMALADSGFLFSWGTNNVNNTLGRTTSTTRDGRALVTADQYGWRHLYQVLKGNKFDTPGIRQIAVNPVDDVTAAVTDDDCVFLIGAGVGDVAAVSVDASFRPMSISVNSAFWALLTDKFNVFAFSSAVRTPFEINANRKSSGQASAVFLSASSSTNIELAIISYSDKDVYARGSALNLPGVFCCSTCFACQTSFQPNPVNDNTKFVQLRPLAAVTKSWGLPVAALPLVKLDGIFDGVSEGKIYALGRDSQIYVLVVSSNVQNPSFVTIDSYFSQPAIKGTQWSDVSGTNAVVALTQTGLVYSQSFGALVLINTAQNLASGGSAVARIYARDAAFATILPAAISLKRPPAPGPGRPSAAAARSIVTVHGVQLTDTSSTSSGTLATALAQFTMAGTTINLDEGTYYEGNLTSSTDSLVISGTGTVIIECSTSPCFRLTGNNVVLQGITIRSTAVATTAAYSVPVGMSHSFTNVTFDSCNGGAVNVLGLLTVKNSVFAGNQAAKGAAITCISTVGSIAVTNTLFERNKALSSSGGALYVQDCTIDLAVTTFTSNSAKQNGGAVSIQRGNFKVTASTFDKNSADNTGGALSFAQVTTATVTSSTLSNNIAALQGGGLFLEFSSVSISQVVFQNNRIPTCNGDGSTCVGGGVYCTGQKVFTVDSTNFTGNSVGGSGQGGAMGLSACSVSMTSSNFFNNNASSGGAIVLLAQSTATIGLTEPTSSWVYNQPTVGVVYPGAFPGDVGTYGCRFSGNAALSTLTGGGAIAVYASKLRLDLSVFSQNRAVAFGGALYMGVQSQIDTPQALLQFEHNNAGSGGGALYWLAGSDAFEPALFAGGFVFRLNMLPPVFLGNTAMYGAIKATQAMTVQWLIGLSSSDQINSGEQIYPAGSTTTAAFTLLLMDGYNQVLASDSKSSVSLSVDDKFASANPNASLAQVVGQGAMPAYDPQYLNASSAPSMVGTLSKVFSRGAAPFGVLLDLNGFGVQTTPGKAVAIKAVAQLGEGEGVLTAKSIVLPTRWCQPGEKTTAQKCQKCDAGSYSATQRATDCIQCTSGSYALNQGQSSCDMCPPGFACTTTSKALCPEGSYTFNSSSYNTSKALAGTCTLCPSDSVANANRTLCLCVAKFYMTYNAPADQTNQLEGLLCRKCPVGGDCFTVGTTINNVKPLQGYWPDISGVLLESLLFFFSFFP
jgi:predicted outer membrane repeat protein